MINNLENFVSIETYRILFFYYKNKEGQYNRVELSYYTNLLLGNNNLYYTSVSDLFIRI